MTLEDVEWAATGRHRFRAVMVDGVCGARAAARDGRRVRHPRLFGAAARARLRRPPRARRDQQRRAAPRRRRARFASSPPARSIGLVAVGAARPADRDSMLFGVQPLDLTTFASVTFVLALTAAVSIAGPAWRAAQIDPAVALRHR